MIDLCGDDARCGCDDDADERKDRAVARSPVRCLPLFAQ